MIFLYRWFSYISHCKTSMYRAFPIATFDLLDGNEMTHSLISWIWGRTSMASIASVMVYAMPWLQCTTGGWLTWRNLISPNFTELYNHPNKTYCPPTSSASLGLPIYPYLPKIYIYIYIYMVIVVADSTPMLVRTKKLRRGHALLSASLLALASATDSCATLACALRNFGFTLENPKFYGQISVEWGGKWIKMMKHHETRDLWLPQFSIDRPNLTGIIFNSHLSLRFLRVFLRLLHLVEDMRSHIWKICACIPPKYTHRPVHYDSSTSIESIDV